MKYEKILIEYLFYVILLWNSDAIVFIQSHLNQNKVHAAAFIYMQISHSDLSVCLLFLTVYV